MQIRKIRLSRENEIELLDALKDGGAADLEGIGRITVKKVSRKGFDVYRQKHGKKQEYFLPFFKLDKDAKKFISGE